MDFALYAFRCIILAPQRTALTVFATAHCLFLYWWRCVCVCRFYCLIEAGHVTFEVRLCWARQGGQEGKARRFCRLRRRCSTMPTTAGSYFRSAKMCIVSVQQALTHALTQTPPPPPHTHTHTQRVTEFREGMKVSKYPSEWPEL